MVRTDGKKLKIKTMLPHPLQTDRGIHPGGESFNQKHKVFYAKVRFCIFTSRFYNKKKHEIIKITKQLQAGSLFIAVCFIFIMPILDFLPDEPMTTDGGFGLQNVDCCAGRTVKAVRNTLIISPRQQS